MCGLTAVVAPGSSARDLDRVVSEITGALGHRGPDHEARAVLGPVALGHTRLRVMDPRPEADQPMSFGAAHLVFSGAIFNHRELRRELEARGVVFRTTGDTEVLLHALRLDGALALPRLRGMFAFVFYDAERRRVLAARDRVGIKPLVWARRRDGAVFFASEARALVRASGVDRSIDRTALREILRFNHPLGDRTFFAHVKSLEPGCAIELDVDFDADAGRGAPRVRRWASLRIEAEPCDLDAAVERLDERFRAAVRRAVDVDVPFGCYLSGGLDSTGIVAEVARASRGGARDVRAYSLVLPGVAYSEEAHVDRAAAALGVTPRKVAIRGLGLRDYVDYATRAEMPQWWSSDLALGELAKRARADGTRVVLTGEGPDELFAGYDVYRVAPWRPLLAAAGRRAAPWLGRGDAAGPLLRRFLPWLDVDSSVAREWVARHDPRRRASVVDHFGFYPENLALWGLLEARAPLARGSAPDDAEYREHERAYFRGRFARGASRPATSAWPCSRAVADGIERNLEFEITERLPRWILHMGDRMSSAHGIEARFPYLEDGFLDAALRLPMRARIGLLENKRALRRVHQRRLPASIATRAKQPLYTPTAEWLPAVLSDPGLERYWSRAAFERAGLLDFDACEPARARLASGAAPDALTRMVDEWLFSFALTTSILAVDLAGA